MPRKKSEIIATETSQLSVFDYSSYSEEFKLKSYERKARIKANEQVATKAFYDIAQDVKSQKSDCKNRQDFLNWCKSELNYQEDMADQLVMIAEQLPDHVRVESLPSSFRALKVLSRALRDSDEETKQKILDEAEAKTEETGKPLTEKQINELPEVKQLKEKLKAEQEARKKAEEAKTKAEQTESDLTAKLAVVLNERDSFKTTSENQNKQIKELNSNISDKQKDLDSIAKEKKQLQIDRQNLEKKIKEEADKIVKDELKEKQDILAKQEAELKKKETQLTSDLKAVESLKRTAQRQKDNLDSTQEWITNFQLTNTYLVEATHELKKYKKHLQKNPDLSELEEKDRAIVEEKIKNLIVDFNDNLHNLGGAINYLNGAVVKFNNYALRVIDATVEVE